MNDFVNLNTLGLRRSERIKEKDLNQTSSSKLAIYKATKALGLLAMATASVSNTTYDHTHAFYSTKAIKY